MSHQNGSFWSLFRSHLTKRIQTISINDNYINIEILIIPVILDKRQMMNQPCGLRSI